MPGHRSTGETFPVAYHDLRKLGFGHAEATRDARVAADETARALDGPRSTPILSGGSSRPNPHRVPFPWERRSEAT